MITLVEIHSAKICKALAAGKSIQEIREYLIAEMEHPEFGDDRRKQVMNSFEKAVKHLQAKGEAK